MTDERSATVNLEGEFVRPRALVATLARGGAHHYGVEVFIGPTPEQGNMRWCAECWGLGAGLLM